MIVKPLLRNLWSDTTQLDQLVLQQQYLTNVNSQRRGTTKIISISWPIPSIDPLLILSHLLEPQQLHFYFESSQTETTIPHKRDYAIAAFDAVLSLTVDGADRFALARDFIVNNLQKTIPIGDLHLPLAGPHFFCSFGFFDQTQETLTSFPAATVFLPKWQVARCQNDFVLVANFLVNNDEMNWKKWFGETEEILAKIYVLADQFYSNNSYEENQSLVLDSFDRDHLKENIKDILKSIQAQNYQKIVLSQTIAVQAKHPLSLTNCLNNLRQIQSGCYIFSTGDCTGKYFIGASPERLIRLDNNRLTTDALAGSAARGETSIEDQNLGDRLLANPKEKHEHQVVIDFIMQCLTNLGLTPELSQSTLLKLSNIQHLWTPIQATVPPHLHLLDILAQLHPTPAVAGLPREIACQAIRRYEKFERALYAAPLGWIDHRGNGEFVVGIRSAIIDGHQATLFAGAGIVAGSDPDKELAEIQLKFQALLKALV